MLFITYNERATPAANATPRTCAEKKASTANEAIERGSNAGRAERLGGPEAVELGWERTG